VAATALLLVAFFPMQERRLPLAAAVALAVGLLLWITVARQLPVPAPETEIVPWQGGPRVAPLVLVALLAIAAWIGSSGNRFRLIGVCGWLGSVAAWIWAWAPRRSWTRDEAAGPRRIARRAATVAALALVLALGTWLYFHRLAATPGNPTSDHAETLLDLNDVLDGQRHIFFPRNTGREPWKFYWLFVLVRLFGLPAKYLTLKVATVTIGLVGIPAIFLLGRELGGAPLGLLAAALTAWSKWPLGVSRIGLRFSYAFFPTALALWALFRYLRRGDRASALWAGAWTGVGLYGYIPARAVPLAIPVALAIAVFDWRWRGSRRRLAIDGLLMADTAALVFLPLAHFAIERPDLFWMRAASRAGHAANPVTGWSRSSTTFGTWHLRSTGGAIRRGSTRCGKTLSSTRSARGCSSLASCSCSRRSR
jgi:hypothetical protein